MAATELDHPIPAKEATFVIEPPSLILSTSPTVNLLRPRQLTFNTSSAGNVGGKPATLHRPSIRGGKASIRSAIDCGSDRSPWNTASAPSTASRSTPSTVAPWRFNSTRVSLPIPDAAPVTTMVFPLSKAASDLEGIVNRAGLDGDPA